MCLKFTKSLVDDAFRARQEAYPDWKIEPYVKIWKLAFSAFNESNPNRNAFDELYNELKGKWQVFRNVGKAGTALSADEVWKMLSEMDKKARQLCLSGLKKEDENIVQEVVNKAKSIKTGKAGASSLMAMTKFLHFWNPRLFIIVDRQVMANNVLRRLWWLRKSLPNGFVADANHYVGLLQWASDILRDNPVILQGFHKHIQSVASGKNLPDDWKTYEATAVEWFLEGVVELPPHGVLQVG